MRNTGYNYKSYNYKKMSNLGKLYILPKILRGLHDVPGRPVISNYGTPTENVWVFGLSLKTSDAKWRVLVEGLWTFFGKD